MWKRREQSKDGRGRDEMEDSIVYEVRSRGPWLRGWIRLNRTIGVRRRSELWGWDCNVEDRERCAQVRLRGYGRRVCAQCETSVVA